MKLTTSVPLCMLLITLLFACHSNYQNVEVNGLVSDATTGEPITEAKVSLKCWVYDSELGESKAVRKQALTNPAGEFSIIFAEGEAIDVLVEATGYADHTESLTLDGNNLKMSVGLIKQ